MVSNKSLDDIKIIIAAMLRDANASHGVVFNTRALRLTTQKVISRLGYEGVGFLTKTLPRLGKCFDQALSGACRFTCNLVGCKPYKDTELPKLFGEFYVTIFAKDGNLLQDPDAKSVRILRELFLAFSKYKLPYEAEQEREVLQAFKDAEVDLKNLQPFFKSIEESCDPTNPNNTRQRYHGQRIDFFRDAEGVLFRPIEDVVRNARKVLQRLFLSFDARDIYPRHGPGAVATKQRNSAKFRWLNVSKRITDLYPFDEYFCSSLGHVCDVYRDFNRVGSKDLSARVILVPKDSRGPRLISAEPVDFQWIQQGLSKAIVHHVESHTLTKGYVNFTDQNVNRNKALEGSITLDNVTLDLKEASDRVSHDLVRLLFPDTVFPYLDACRSLATELPTGEVLSLQKFAPMGSALCFPILALTIWALLHGAAPNADIRKSIYVYGDDVIVPKAYASCAMATLELFGLKINRNKSCCSGLFRESCGMDAFKGIDVTPVRFRTVWDKSPRPDAYTSYISYANAFYDRGWIHTYREICSRLYAVYGPVPGEDISHKRYPSLRYSTSTERDFKTRWNSNLQRKEFKVYDVHSPSHLESNVCGWQKLLRFFSESASPRTDTPSREGNILYPKGGTHGNAILDFSRAALSVSLYTDRRASVLVRRWR
jgi:hypothetical protein